MSISSSYDRGKDHIVVRVRDEGIGIDEEEIDRIKEPFFTRKQSEGGTGLGLYVSTTIIEEHNGSLVIESGKVNETVAVVHLPVGKARDRV